LALVSRSWESPKISNMSLEPFLASKSHHNMMNDIINISYYDVSHHIIIPGTSKCLILDIVICATLSIWWLTRFTAQISKISRNLNTKLYDLWCVCNVYDVFYDVYDVFMMWYMTYWKQESPTSSGTRFHGQMVHEDSDKNANNNKQIILEIKCKALMFN